MAAGVSDRLRGGAVAFPEFPISAYPALIESDGCQCRSMGDIRGGGDLLPNDQ